MVKINTNISRKIIDIILCLIVISVFFGESSDSKLFIPGESLYWLHARAILSLTMILFLVSTILFNNPQNLFKNFLYRKEFLALSGVFIFLFIGFINSESYAYIFQRLQVKLPFLILPICAASAIISRKSFHTVLYVFIVTTFISCLYTFANYLFYFDQINASYLHSKVMPSPINHVRFSIIVALATYTSYYLYKNNFSLFKSHRLSILIIGIFLFIFTHIYSVRSGIIALYAMMFMEVLIYFFKDKSYKKGLFAVLLILISGITMMYFSPSLRNKMINTQQDLSVLQNEGNANNNSLATRFVSYEIAFDLFKENIFLGCGLGDLEIKNTKLFHEKHPEIAIPIIPHNQFLYYLASMGIIGLLAFTFCFFFPLFYARNYRNEFLLMVYVTLFLSFITEPMIENQLGVACTVIFVILPLMIKKEERFS